jgi:NADPH-dependent curcumin reductase CurA
MTNDAVATRNRQWVLASRPGGRADESNFRLIDAAVPVIQDGHALIKVHYLSLDPYMRGRMDDVKSYAPPQKLDEVMVGGTVGEVVESKAEKLRRGDMVVGMGGWQEYFATDAAGVRVIDTRRASASAYLGVLGMPGVTAWYGLLRIGRPKVGETVVVSAASGAVGSVVGQLARIHGGRAVGFAGGAEKCHYVVHELGFDACIDYKSDSARAEFAAATPGGVDVVFENVGGAVFDTALARMNTGGRVALCGLIAGYNRQDIALRNVRSILVNRLAMTGFIVSDHLELWPQALEELGRHVTSGALKYRESIAIGIENAPKAFIGLLSGENFGKQLVKL